MRFANLHVGYVRTAVLASLLMAACSCQTAQKPVALLPPTTAPALKPTAPAAAPTPVAKPTVAQAQDAPPQKPASPQSPAPADGTARRQGSSPVSDPVGDLIAKAEKEYQAGLANHQAGKLDEAKQN